MPEIKKKKIKKKNKKKYKIHYLNNVNFKHK